MNWVLGGFGDWLAYLREATPVTLETAPQTFRLPAAGVAELHGAKSTFSFELGSNPTTGLPEPTITQNITNCLFCVDLSAYLPTNGILYSINVAVQASTAYAAIPPSGELPTLAVWQVLASGDASILGTAEVDSSGDLAAYKLRHLITKTLETPTVLTNEALFGSGSNEQRRLLLMLQGGTTSPLAHPVYFSNFCAHVGSVTWGG
jgi:hypothetical protein